MNIRDLSYLIAVADQKNFSLAAKQCFVSQPTLSGQIKKIEDELGVIIFERSNKRVMLTTTGRKIIEIARRILVDVEAMKAIAQDACDPLTGKFKLAAIPTLAPYLFPKIVKPLMHHCPKLQWLFSEEKTADCLEKLASGKIDAAIVALPIQGDFLKTKRLFGDDFYLAVGPNHKFSALKTISQKALKDEPLLLLNEGHCLRDQALAICAKHGIHEDSDFCATSLETLRETVKAGAGITLMPAIAKHPREAGIHYIPFKKPTPKREIALAWRKTSVRTAIIEKILRCFEGMIK